MKTVDKYKNDVINMFFLSVDKDIKKYRGSVVAWFESQLFDGNNYFKIDYKNGILILITDKNNVEICRYKKKIFNKFVTKIKIRNYVKKINNHLKQVEIDRADKKEIESLEFALLKIQKVYIKDVRKQKLDKIS